MKAFLKILFISCLVLIVAGLLGHLGGAGSIVVGIALAVLLSLGVAGLLAAAATTVGLIVGAIGLAIGLLALVVVVPVLIPVVLLLAPLLLVGALITGLASICG